MPGAAMMLESAPAKEEQWNRMSPASPAS
jgi:hypothetical protein